MTSIAVWPGVDSRGVSSLYIASDSRITWGNGHSWDQGRKVFACASRAHIFGYCGDVLFPALAIPVLVDRIDRGLLASGEGDWHKEILQAIRLLWKNYPAERRLGLSIMHGVRMGSGMTSRFSLAVMEYKERNSKWIVRNIAMPERSTLLVSEGSGASAVRNSYDLWQQGHSAHTSRAVFSAFCDSIVNQKDPNTGGPAQLAGLYRIGNGRLYGIVHAGKRFFAGATLAGFENTEEVEWRNRLFERVAGGTKQRLLGAQQHEPLC